MQVKTIDLPGEHSFQEALSQLLAGTCLGIRPETNTRYITLFKPHWMNQKSPDWMLRWSGDTGTADIRSNQYLGTWRLVVMDHRELPELVAKAATPA